MRHLNKQKYKPEGQNMGDSGSNGSATRGSFIVFEGGEGSSKTTQAELLKKRLTKDGYDVLLTKEPGGDEGVCREIRKIVLDTAWKTSMAKRAELFLFLADKAQHVERIIEPALRLGKIVVSDRYEAATFAYQCGARKSCSIEEFLALNNLATGGLRPDLTIWLDVDPRLGLRRNTVAKKRDRFELEDLEFHRDVRGGYRTYFEFVKAGGQWVRIPVTAKRSRRQIHEVIYMNIKRLLD